MLKFIFTWWGNFRYSWNSSMFYIQIIQFSIILILGYDTSLHGRIYNITGLDISLVPFLFIIIVPFILVMFFEHNYTTAATSRRGAELFYEQGPFKEQFEIVKTELKDTKEDNSKRLESIEGKLDILLKEKNEK